MKIEVDGYQRFQLMRMVNNATTHSRTERRFYGEFGRKLLSQEERDRASSAGTPGAFDLAKLRALGMREVSLSGAEASGLLAAMEEFDKVVGILTEDGGWFDPLIDLLKGWSAGK